MFFCNEYQYHKDPLTTNTILSTILGVEILCGMELNFIHNVQ